MVIKNGKILLFEQNGFVPRDIRIENGKIVEISDHLEGKENEDVYDAEGSYVTPGLIDAHSHICISEESNGDMGDDCCDYSGALTPELEVLDGLYPFDRAVADCVHAGVTTACVAPGSDGVVGGIASVIRLKGTVADDTVISRKAAMKCSVGENPKTAKHGFASRMGVAYQLRKCLEDARDYKHQKETAISSGNYFRKDIGMENMLLVLDKQIPVHMHAHRSDDICTAIRIAREYDIDMVLIHCTDGIPIADYLEEQPYPIVVGPTMSPRSKLETRDKTFATAGILSQKGLKVCLCSDHDVIHAAYLPVYAAMAARYGMEELEALKAITINPAEVLRIADRKGSIAVGKDADLVVWSGYPLEFSSYVKEVFLEGEARGGQEAVSLHELYDVHGIEMSKVLR